MGSAQRSKAGSRAVSAARGSAGGGRGGIYAGIAVIVVLAVVVAVGMLLTRNRHTGAAIPPVRISASYRSNPPGYSLQAANAGLCAAKAGVFPSYHASLYGKQPEEGAAGYTVDQLVALGRALGTQGNFEPCVRSATFDVQVKSQLASAETSQALSQQTANGPSFGTPTVPVNGKVIPVLTQAGSAQFDQEIS
ncbi:MAG: DsbA family protein [Pseudonocardiaceae bacterium]